MIDIHGKELIDIIDLYSSLEWYKYRKMNDSSQLKYAPINIWRYDETVMSKQEIEDLETKITIAIDKYKGTISWTLYFSGRNWVLLPERIKFIEDSGKYHNDIEVLEFLAKEYPEFGIQANM